ncbi:nucleotide disphospho-sugar-binding domain-containing protein [Micromonospora sp. LOL_023]|uniref:nucleotide disphospho-sugar-binding domain-containing protein n=1 Tax=Micromonospora sp. LOL_023 TaxID=3345418 RepID=UPI003A840559
MRVLVTSPPGAGHLFPTVPLAWALRAAGHEVLVGTAAEGLTGAADAGLPAVDVAPGAPIGAAFGAGSGSPAELADRMRRRGQAIAAAGSRADPLLLELFGRVSDLMADGTVALARWWRPDLVVHSRLHPAGLLAARAVRVPAVEHGFNLVREEQLAARFLPYLAAAATRNGVPLELPERVVLHLAPAELMVGDGDGWPMRYLPYNAGGTLPDWLRQPATRPRVLITLGTVVPALAGLAGLRHTIDAAGHTDADFVLAVGAAADPTVLGPLPRNVRPAGWLPLRQALAGCTAVVHHGGSGTMMTALGAGVPQLVLPHGADQFGNADLVVRHRLGMHCDPAGVTSRTLAELLSGGPATDGVSAAATLMAALPPPAEIAARLATVGTLAEVL